MFNDLEFFFKESADLGKILGVWYPNFTSLEKFWSFDDNRHKKENQKNTLTNFGCEKYLQKGKKELHLKVLMDEEWWMKNFFRMFQCHRKLELGEIRV